MLGVVVVVLLGLYLAAGPLEPNDPLPLNVPNFDHLPPDEDFDALCKLVVNHATSFEYDLCDILKDVKVDRTLPKAREIHGRLGEFRPETIQTFQDGRRFMRLYFDTLAEVFELAAPPSQDPSAVKAFETSMANVRRRFEAFTERTMEYFRQSEHFLRLLEAKPLGNQYLIALDELVRWIELFVQADADSVPKEPWFLY